MVFEPWSALAAKSFRQATKKASLPEMESPKVHFYTNGGESKLVQKRSLVILPAPFYLTLFYQRAAPWLP